MSQAKVVRETFKLQRLFNPTEDQVLRSAELFVELRQHDAGVISLAGGDPALLKILAASLIRASAVDGGYYAATNEADEVLGYVAAAPKGKPAINDRSLEEQHRLGYTAFTEALSEQGAKYYQEVYLEAFPSFITKSFAPTSMDQIWWLSLVMTRKESQRQGIATDLVRMVLDQAQAAGDTVALSTHDPVNIPIYEHMGFKEVGRKDGTTPWGNYTMWLMRWDPPAK